MRFVWSLEKAASNVAKHGVTFEEAVTVFADPNARTEADEGHDDRLILIGLSASARTLFVVFVELEADDLLRIVSARKASPAQRKRYAETR